MLDAVRDFLHHGAWTDYPTPVVVGVFIVICAIGVAFFVPKTVLAPAAGALFGAVNGTIITVTGATLGSVLALHIGRRLGRERVRAWLHRKQSLADLDARLTRHGVLPVAVLRLVPVIPGFVVNYGSAATGIRTLHFTVGTAVGLVPVTMFQVAAGASVRSGLSTPVVVTATAGGLLVLAAPLIVRRLQAGKPVSGTAAPTGAGAADAPGGASEHTDAGSAVDAADGPCHAQVSPPAGQRPDGAA
ncbi:MAG TPA: TVP38/TMEM64 family protein [Yinghuangia sp.]|uniref:TVP38/TMEM64 family protein n=1 Tax=Yinghuangia sp. YIM S10712 TaxID=3436930 RepID=UPI002CF3AEE4|nr:TVP38/TMEM64 family protein [Yinghuangia sp.]